jgi:hypothetical protein
LRITVTLGTYPVLQVASAPQPLVMIGGLALFLAALAWSFVGASGAAAVAPEPSEPEATPILS